MDWRPFARLLGIVTALATAAAGWLLLYPHSVAIGFPVPEGLGQLGAFLLVFAALSLLSDGFDVKRLGGTRLRLYLALVGIPLLGCCGIAVVLAVRGVAAGRYELALLALPALTTLLPDRRTARALPSVSPEDVGLVPQYGRAQRLGVILVQIWATTLQVLALVVSAWSVPVAIAAYRALQALLLGSGAMTLPGAVAALLAQEWYPGFAAIVLVISVVSQAWSGAAQHVRLIGVKDANRNLSLRELNEIETAFEQAAEYADKRKYYEQNWPMALGILALSLITIALFAGIFIAGRVMQTHVIPVFLFCFTAFVGVLALPRVLLALAWRAYVERNGWRTLAYQDGFAGVMMRLVVLMRRHRLPAPFDASDFLAREGRRVPRLLLVLFALFAAATVLVAFAKI